MFLSFLFGQRIERIYSVHYKSHHQLRCCHRIPLWYLSQHQLITLIHAISYIELANLLHIIETGNWWWPIFDDWYQNEAQKYIPQTSMILLLICWIFSSTHRYFCDANLIRKIFMEFELFSLRMKNANKDRHKLINLLFAPDIIASESMKIILSPLRSESNRWLCGKFVSGQYWSRNI